MAYLSAYVISVSEDNGIRMTYSVWHRVFKWGIYAEYWVCYMSLINIYCSNLNQGLNHLEQPVLASE